MIWTADYAIKGRRFGANGVPIGEERELVSPRMLAPRLAADEEGSFVLFWKRFDDMGNAWLEAQRFDADLEPVGDAVVVWTSNEEDGEGYGVAAQRYRNDPAIVPPSLLLDYTDPVVGFQIESVEEGDDRCRAKFGEDWRWLEFHEQWGWGVKAAWRRGAPGNTTEDRGWVGSMIRMPSAFPVPSIRG